MILLPNGLLLQQVPDANRSFWVVTTNALGSAPYSFVCLSFFSMVYPFLTATTRTNTDPYTIEVFLEATKILPFLPFWHCWTCNQKQHKCACVRERGGITVTLWTFILIAINFTKKMVSVT